MKTSIAKLGILSTLATVGAPALANGDSVNDIDTPAFLESEEQVDFAVLRLKLAELKSKLASDQKFFEEYRANPAESLIQFGFSEDVVREILIEDGLIFDNEIQLEVCTCTGCCVTCACTGCCSTSA